MIIKNISIPEVENETVIWRYMDFSTFYALLTNKALFFRRLDKQTDKLEGTLNEKIIEDFFKKWKSFEFSDSESQRRSISEKENIISYRQFTLANSWTIAENEDYALWKIYLRGSKEGIAIKTIVKKLKESLNKNKWNINLAKVNYELKSEDLNQHSVTTYKRKSYKYENELRAYILHQFGLVTNENGTEEKAPLFDIGVNVEVDLNLLIDEIYISPFSAGWFHEIVKSAINIFLENKNISIRQSEIEDS